MTERTEFKFLGKIIGTGTGWDGEHDGIWWIYDFEPSGYGLSACPCLVIDEVKGEITEQDNEGNTIKLHNITWSLT